MQKKQVITTITKKQVIKTHQQDGFIDSEAETAFLKRADVSVIVSMMKIEKSQLGKEFIHELAQSFTEKNRTLSIEMKLGEESTSLEAYFYGFPKDVKIGIRPGADLPVDLRSLAHEINNVDSQLFIRQEGTSSSLVFPVRLNINPADLDDTWENFDEIWKNKTTNEALGDVLSGNFSLTINLVCFILHSILR